MYVSCVYASAGAPIILTLPHMMDAAPEYRTVPGMQPDEDKHGIFVDLEPVSLSFLKNIFEAYLI